MNFKIQDEEGNVQGPANEETLIKWTEADKIHPGTPMRNSLMSAWKKAEDFAFLKDSLEKQSQQEEKNKGFWDKALSDKPQKKTNEPVNTSFEYTYLPAKVGMCQRLAAVSFDWALIFVFTLFLWLAGNTIVYFSDINSGKPINLSELSNEEEEEATKDNEEGNEPKPAANNMKAEAPPERTNDKSADYKFGSVWLDNLTGIKYTCLNGAKREASWVKLDTIHSVFYKLFFIWITVVMLYYGLALGLYAQTFGMWFWGIFIVKKDVSEVFLFRAFAFVLLMFIFGAIAPVFVFVLSKRRAAHDILAGAMLIKIAGQPKT